MSMLVTLKLVEDTSLGPKYSYLNKLYKNNRVKTTKRIRKDYLDKMNWRMWEIHADMVGKLDNDPVLKSRISEMPVIPAAKRDAPIVTQNKATFKFVTAAKNMERLAVLNQLQ